MIMGHNIFREIKIFIYFFSGNILLDSNLEAKISDLGMAQHATSGSETGLLTHITKKQADTKQYQTRAYLPPEAQRGSKMSVKGDTYSFGVVSFLILSLFRD